MTEYRIVVKPEGWLLALDEGRMDGPKLEELTRFTDRPLLADEAEMEALRAFLRSAPSQASRWTKPVRAEGARLACLVENDCCAEIHPRVMEHLKAFLRGRLRRSRGRPNHSEKYQGVLGLDLSAEILVDYATKCLQDGRPLEFEGRPLLEEPCPDWSALPIAKRALRIAHEVLRRGGRNPPSPATLRNRLSKKAAEEARQLARIRLS